jgi:hypothetical protein
MLVLCLALDLSALLGPEVMEDLKESQEVVPVSHARQPLRLVWDVSVALGVDPAHTAAVRPVQRATWNPASRPVTSGWVRKIPPSIPDSPSAPEDH